MLLAAHGRMAAQWGLAFLFLSSSQVIYALVIQTPQHGHGRASVQFLIGFIVPQQQEFEDHSSGQITEKFT